MPSEKYLLIFLLVCGMTILLWPKIKTLSPSVNCSCPNTSYHGGCRDLTCELRAQLSKQHRRIELFRQQRDELSSLFNFAMKSFGQQSCDMVSLRQQTGQQTNTVSEHGGWCAKQSSEGGGQHYWDKGLNNALSKFFKGKTVGSFGDGPGRYSKEINNMGEVKSYTAYDGAPFCENVTGGVVTFLDLTVPHYGLPAYD